MSSLRPKEKVERLLGLAEGHKRALILTHDNPDPDSMAAAWALAQLLGTKAGLQTRVAFGGIVGRAENKAMIRVLKLPLVPVARVVFDDYDFIGLVDTQPSVGNHSLPPRYRADVVIDHHPPRSETMQAEFADVGGDYGATSTMLVEYLRAAELKVSPEMATALFYGIKADTRDLGRETTRTDVDSYLYLFPLADKLALGQIEYPSLPARYFRLYHRGIAAARVYGSSIVADLGEVYSPDMVAEVAERLWALQGMKWSLALGIYERQIYLSVRTNDRRMNAGRMVRHICSELGGSAGGHGSMAGARLPLPSTRSERDELKRRLIRRFLLEFGEEHTAGVPLLEYGQEEGQA